MFVFRFILLVVVLSVFRLNNFCMTRIDYLYTCSLLKCSEIVSIFLKLNDSIVIRVLSTDHGLSMTMFLILNILVFVIDLLQNYFYWKEILHVAKAFSFKSRSETNQDVKFVFNNTGSRKMTKMKSISSVPLLPHQ